MYSRKIDGKVLTLASSGWTYDDLFILYDYETESMWYELPGTNALTCIAGFYVGRQLASLASEYVSWETWFNKHPNTLVLPRG